MCIRDRPSEEEKWAFWARLIHHYCGQYQPTPVMNDLKEMCIRDRLERARADAAGQENMTLCCDFLALRLALCGKGKEEYDFAAKRAALLQRCV